MIKESKGNYKDRMKVWREQLLNERAQHVETIRSNNASINLMKKSNKLHQDNIDFVNKEIEFANKEIAEL